MGGGEELQVLLTQQVDLNYEKHFFCDGDLPEEELLFDALKGCLSEVKGSSRELLDKRYEAGRTIRSTPGIISTMPLRPRRREFWRICKIAPEKR